LDLLRVVSHHRARLATPIRTVQKIYSEADSENIPFADTIFTRSRAANRPFLLVEPPYKVNGEDKVKPSTRATRTNEEKDSRIDETMASDTKGDENFGSTSTSSTDVNNSRDKSKSFSESQTKRENAVDERKGSTIPVSRNLAQSAVPESSPVATHETTSATSSQSKQDDEKSSVSSSSVRPSLEENILLGVALEGSKRTLPIEEEMTPSAIPPDSQEFAVQRNGGGPPASKDKKDGQSSSPTGKQND